MVKREDMYLKNYAGTLMYLDEPLFMFEIRDMKLIEYKLLKEDTVNFPMEFVVMGITYKALNLFFRDRVVVDGSMWIREYLDALGMDRYDFETIVKKNHGNNNLDNWWVDDGSDWQFRWKRKER